MNTSTTTAPSTYPMPTIEAAAVLKRMVEASGVGMRVGPDGGLQLRDQGRRLSPADRDLVRHYGDLLVELLTGAGDTSRTQSRCTRCGASAWIDTTIHGGRSTRRDCATCGRTEGFPRWNP
jgi:hypothetical protein